MKKVTYIECEYHEIENLVIDHLGLEDYEFPCIQESSNDTSHTFRIDGKISKYDEEYLKKILSTKKATPFSNYILMNELCRRGVIEPGEYLVNVSW